MRNRTGNRQVDRAGVRTRTIAAVALLLFGAGVNASRAAEDNDTILAGPPPEKKLSLAIMLSSDSNRCFLPGVSTAVRHFTRQRVDEFNAGGGIAGRTVQLVFLDDFEKKSQTVANVDKALAMPDIAALIGINSSTRGHAVMESVGNSGVPLISGMSRDDFFEQHPNIFSMEPAAGDEIAVVKRFIERSNFRRPAFIGFEGDLYAERYSRALVPEEVDAGQAAGAGLGSNHWLPFDPSFRLNEEAARAVIAKLQLQKPDLLLMAIHSGPGSNFLRLVREAGLDVPVFVVLGRINRMSRLMANAPYNANMFELARDGIPHVLNERLQQRLWKHPEERWIFDDVRAPDGPAKCERFVDPDLITDVRSRKNRRAIGRGVQYADAVALVLEAARRGAKPADTVAVIRKRIATGLAELRESENVQRGWWQDWSFTPARAAATDVLIVRKLAGETEIALAPQQHLKRQGKTRAVPVVYIAVDMTRIYRVDSNEKTFHADFFLSYRTSGNVTFRDIEFTNAFRSPVSNTTVISARRIHSDASRAQGLQLYKVTGKFYFDPQLEQYPFDQQRFSISFQPANTATPFYIQPPSHGLRRAGFATDGWDVLAEYVGADKDIISVIATQADKKLILPLNKFNYTWIMKRVATNYYLRVLVPLVVILAVTFLSIFIPAQRLESVVAIQVTALLSSIALYLAIPKVEYDHATTSDNVFVVAYLTITLMLGLSILRTNLVARERPGGARTIQLLQLVALPLIVFGVLDYVLAQDAARMPLTTSAWNWLAGQVGLAG